MKDLFDHGTALLCDAVDRFPWNNKNCYAQYLAQSYFYLQHSTRLLALGAAGFSADEEHLHWRYLSHAREEKSHHLLVVRDLEALGKKLEDFREMPWTKAVYEPQYYKIEYLDPTALFGYILALEGLAVKRAGEICNKVEACFGKSAASFLRVHGNEDPDHLDKALVAISSLGDQRRLDIIRDNFEQSCLTLIHFFDQIHMAAGASNSSNRSSNRSAA